MSVHLRLGITSTFVMGSWRWPVDFQDLAGFGKIGVGSWICLDPEFNPCLSNRLKALPSRLPFHLSPFLVEFNDALLSKKVDVSKENRGNW